MAAENETSSGTEPVDSAPKSRLQSSMELGQIAGVPIRLDWSLLIVAGLMSFSLVVGVFHPQHPDWSPLLTWLTALIAVVMFFASVLFHELSHALVGRVFGIEVRRITLFMFGGIAQLENEPKTWTGELAMAIAGPIASLCLSLIFVELAGLNTGPVDVQAPVQVLKGMNPAATVLIWLASVNVILAVFNLVPGFPLDGGRVLRAIVWGLTGNIVRATRWASLTGQLFAMVLIVSGVSMVFGFTVPFLGTGPFSGVWVIFIGWFLNNAAVISYQQFAVRETIDGLSTPKLMQT